MNITSDKTKYYENKRLCGCGKNKAKTNPNQSQFLKIPDDLSIIISAPLLTGLDYSLFFGYFAFFVNH